MALYLIIMGVQGAGKGTQAAFVKEAYGIPHISTGDLFRAMRTREDELARRVQSIMESGHLVPDDVTNEVLQDRLEQPDAANGVILDGYPRNVAQAEWLENYLAQRGEQLTATLLLDLDLFTAFKRAFGRVKSPATGETYNLYFQNGDIEWGFVEHPDKAFPPRIEAKLKSTDETLTRRADDHAGGVVQRIDTYLETTRPLIDHYEAKGLLKTVDADQPIQSVNAAIRAAIDSVKVQ